MVWILLALLLLTYLLNKMSLAYGFINLEYKMELDKNTAEIGEKIEISSIVENRKPLNISFLKITENYPKGINIGNNQYNIFSLPYERVVRKYNI